MFEVKLDKFGGHSGVGMSGINVRQIWVILVPEVGSWMDKMAGWADANRIQVQTREFARTWWLGPCSDKAPCTWRVVGDVAQREVANACSVLVWSMFGQIGPTGQTGQGSLTGHFGQQWPKFENFIRTEMGVSGNFEIKHLWGLSGVLMDSMVLLMFTIFLETSQWSTSLVGRLQVAWGRSKE